MDVTEVIILLRWENVFHYLANSNEITASSLHFKEVKQMERYDCKECVHSGKGSVFHRNKKCQNCTVDSKNVYGKPSNFQRKETIKLLSQVL